MRKTAFQIGSRFHPKARRQGATRPLESADVLEIGPFATPSLVGPKVSYFDVLDQEALRQRAKSLGLDTSRVPKIDHVSPNGDLSVVDARFDHAFSAHCIEHQPDLIGHLQSVERLLRPGGSYVLVVPDHRYCFDHYFGPSDAGEVIQAHKEGRKTHSMANVLRNHALATHNRKKLHWLGAHGKTPADRAEAGGLKSAIDTFEAAGDSYIDVHAWQFTPKSFAALMAILAELNLIGFKSGIVHNTPVLRREFTAELFL